MGQESSNPIDENTRPETLKSRTINGAATYITSGRAKKIVVMTGAGISTSAGIPDFRSPDTGLYANLARLNLPYPEAVFDISFFKSDPLPFYTLAHELYPGKYRPTITHSFIKLLHDKGLLLKHFTQNIDCLDRAAGVPNEKIIEAHGSFAKQSCIECHTSFPEKIMKQYVIEKKVPHCRKPGCDGLVKPEIVFFGEALPSEFFANKALPAQATLCIVMGTSLTVQPFASLPSLVSDGVPRILINNEAVGSLGSRADDVLILGDCDEGVRKLAAACGWLDELEASWRATARHDDRSSDKMSYPKNKNDVLSHEIDKLTREIDETLKISNSFTTNALGKPDSIAKESSNIITSRNVDEMTADASGHETRADCTGIGLNHVFPHLKRKPLL